MQSTKDFFELVLNPHIIAAAQKVLSENDDVTVISVAKSIVDNYTRLDPATNENDDKIHNYACEVITLGMIWANYYDSIREADGQRIIQI